MNEVIIIQNGKKTIIEPPRSGYGEIKIIFKHEKVLDVERVERIRNEEQELI